MGWNDQRGRLRGGTDLPKPLSVKMLMLFRKKGQLYVPLAKVVRIVHSQCCGRIGVRTSPSLTKADTRTPSTEDPIKCEEVNRRSV